MPALRHDSAGPSWTACPRRYIGADQQVFIATPAIPVAVIDAGPAARQEPAAHPRMYDLKAPILVTRPDTIVLGLGFPTLVPRNGTAAMQVLTPQGVKVSNITFDAGPKKSATLLQLGTPLTAGLGNAADPTLVQDGFFRVGRATAGSVTAAFVVNASDVILDDTWIWRADHGAGAGWTTNACTGRNSATGTGLGLSEVLVGRPSSTAGLRLAGSVDRVVGIQPEHGVRVTLCHRPGPGSPALSIRTCR